MQAAEVTDPDRELSERARLGLSGAFDALVLMYQPRAYRLAWRMTGNESEAEDIVQEAFLRAYRAMGTFRGDSRFGTWLFRIVVNEALMRARAEARRPKLSFEGKLPDKNLGASPGAYGGGAELLDQKRASQQVREALDKLDDAHRAALVLCDMEGLSSEEAGEILGAAPATIRQRAHRARAKLRGLLGHLAGA